MAKKITAENMSDDAEGFEAEQQEPERRNFPDPEAVVRVTGEINAALDKMEADQGRHKAKIKAIYVAARDKHGISSKLLKEEVGQIRRERKRQKRIDALEESEREELVELQKALGRFSDTPLGQAALAAQ